MTKNTADLASLIARAYEQRRDLASDTDAYRLFHGRAEGVPGLEIDRWGDVATIAYPSALAPQLDPIAHALDACERFRAIAARPRPGKPFWLRGDGDTVVVSEHALRFAIDPLARDNPGLFLDARPVRAWIREHSAGRRVLNLFSFTGSLGIAAAAGGARGVTHVDSRTEALERCQRNCSLNGIAVDARDLVRVNVYQHLRRASAARRSCDAIIVDPPPLGERAQRTDRTPGGHGMSALAPRLAAMLAPGGWMLCLFHRAGQDAERALLASAPVALTILWRGGAGPDFPEIDPASPALRAVVFAR